jgi:hypothetical protein
MLSVSFSLILLFVGAANFHEMSVKKAFEDGGVSDILDVFPEKCLKINYPSGVSVDFGNELAPTQVKGILFQY